MSDISVKLLTDKDCDNNLETMQILFLESFRHSFPQNSFDADFIKAKVLQCIGFLKEREALVWGAFSDTQLIGFAYTYLKDYMGENRLHLNHIAVCPDKSHQGVGYALMSQVLCWAETHNVNGIMLDVSAGNTVAINFYRKLGFEVERFSCLKKI